MLSHPPQATEEFRGVDGHRLRRLLFTDLREYQPFGTIEMPSKEGMGPVYHRASGRVERMSVHGGGKL